MQIVDLAEHGILELPDDASDEEVQHAAQSAIIESSADESKRQLAKATLAGAGENVARSMDMLGAVGRTISGVGEYTGALAEDVFHGDVGLGGRQFVPRFLGGGSWTIGEPPPGPVEKGIVGVAKTLPAIAAGTALAFAGVPTPMAFGFVGGSEAAGQGGGPEEILKSAATWAAIPESGAMGRGLAVKSLSKAVDSGLLSAKRITVQKAVESLAAQGGMQLFMAGLDLPAYAAMSPEERKNAIIENTIANSAWFLMDIPHFVPGRPSQTQAEMTPEARAGSWMRDMVDNPATIKALQDHVDTVVASQMPWRKQGYVTPGGEKQMVATSQDVLEPHKPPTLLLTSQQPPPFIPAAQTAVEPTPAAVERTADASSQPTATEVGLRGEGRGVGQEASLRPEGEAPLARPVQGPEAVPPPAPGEPAPVVPISPNPPAEIRPGKEGATMQGPAGALSNAGLPAAILSVLGEAKATQTKFLKELGITIEAARLLPKAKQEALQQEYEMWLEREKGVPPVEPVVEPKPVEPPPVVPPPIEKPKRDNKAIKLLENKIRTAKADEKKYRNKYKVYKSTGDTMRAGSALGRANRAAQELLDLRGQLSQLTDGEKTYSEKQSNITPDDQLLNEIVGSIGSIPIFMPDGAVVKRYLSLMRKKRGGEILTMEDKEFLGTFPRNFEDDYGVGGSVARAAYDAAKAARIAKELFVPVKNGRNMRMDLLLDDIRKRTGKTFKNGQELWAEIEGLANAHYERTKGSETEGAKEKSATAEEQEFIDLTRDITDKSKGSEPLAIDDLQTVEIRPGITKGTQFTLKGTKVEVAEIQFDENQNVVAIVLKDGNKYGVHRIPVGDSAEGGIYELRVDKGSVVEPKGAAEGFVPATPPSEKPVEPTSITAPKYPEYPKLESKDGGTSPLQRHRSFADAVDAWKQQVRTWLATQVETKAIIWEEPTGELGKGTVRALTRNIGNPQKPWRVTSFIEREGKYLPWGHQEYATREEAMLEEGRKVERFHDKMPGRVMDEQEIQGYKNMADVSDKSKLVWYNFKGKFGTLTERLRGTTLMGMLVRDSRTEDGKIAFTEPVEDAGTPDPERLKWLGLERVTTEKQAERPTGIVYNEDYTGPRYRYGMKYRPLQIGAQPKGYIIKSDKPHPDFKTFGTIEYPFELSPDEVKSFELVPLGRVESEKPTLELAKPESVEEQKARLASEETARQKAAADKAAADALAATVESGQGGVPYYLKLGEQDALDPDRKKMRSVPQNFKLAYQNGWYAAKKSKPTAPTPPVEPPVVSPAAEPPPSVKPAAEVKPVAGLTPAESARLAELMNKVENNAAMDKKERDLFRKLSDKAQGVQEAEKPEVVSGSDKKGKQKKGMLPVATADEVMRDELQLRSVEDLRSLLRSGEHGLQPEAVKLINAFLDSPMAKALDGVRFRIADALEQGWQGSYFEGLVELARNANPETGPHEFGHRLWELLPKAVRDQFEAMRVQAIDERLSKGDNSFWIQPLTDLRNNPITGGVDFTTRRTEAGAEYHRDIYHLASGEEFFTHALSKAFKEKVDAKGAGLITRMKDMVRELVAVLRKALGLNPTQDSMLRNIMAGRYEISPETGVASEQNRRRQRNTIEETPPSESDLLSSKDYYEKLRSDYYTQSGAKIASSREKPATPQGLKVGMWRVDTHKGVYGREVSQLRLLDPSAVGLSENLVETNAEGRGWDADRYADWVKQGKAAPPIEVVETDQGTLKVTNGHRRLAAAKKAGTPVLAWVSPLMDVLPSETRGELHYDGDSSKPVIKTGLTIEAWREGNAKRTTPLQGGFSDAGIERPEGFPKFSLAEKKASLPPPAQPELPIEGEAKERKEIPRQVAGVKFGEMHVPEELVKLTEGVRTVIFDGTNQPVDEARTKTAWDLFEQLTNPDTRNAYAGQLAEAIDQRGAAGAVANELWSYGVRMLMRGDARLFEAMRLRSQDLQTIDPADFGLTGNSAAGLALRIAGERVRGGLWSRIVGYTKEQLKVAGERLGVGQEAFGKILVAINELTAKINPDEWDLIIRTGKDSTGKTLEDVLRENGPERKAAEEIVASIPEEGLPPGKRNSILETVYEWMKMETTKADGDQFKEGLYNALLDRFTLTEEQARTISDQTWNRKDSSVSEKTKRLLDAELRAMDSQAEKTARRFITRVYQAERMNPPKDNLIQQIITEALTKWDIPMTDEMQQRVVLAGDAEPGAYVSNWIKELRQVLMDNGLSEGMAKELADAVWSQKQRDFINAQMRARERAAQATSLGSLIESIRSSPYLAQRDPVWRLKTAQLWFESNGLAPESALIAAKQFDAEFVKAFEKAAEKIANQLVRNPDARTIKELLEAVRTGLLDPEKDWTGALAARQNFRPLTKDQFKTLAELEERFNNPLLNPYEAVDLTEQMMGIMRHVGDQTGRFWKIAGESFAASLLSGIRTSTLQVGQPMMHELLAWGVHAVAEPRDFVMLTKMALKAASNFVPEFKYSWVKDAARFETESAGLWKNELKRSFEIAQSEWSKGEYHKAIPRFAYAWQQFVIRTLRSFDQAGIAVLREWNLALYGSIAMRAAGMNTKQISQIVEEVAGWKNAAYQTYLADGKTKLESRAMADEDAANGLQRFFANQTPLGIEKSLQIAEAAVYEGFLMTGRRGPGVAEPQEGMLSSPVNWLMKVVTDARREGGVPSIMTIMAVGFMNVPFRAARYYAGWGPYGLLRWGIHSYMQRNTEGAGKLRKLASKMKGEDVTTFWKQSYKNEYMAKVRLREALVGTGLMMALFGWQHAHSTADDDAEKRKFAMFVTGTGPANKTMRDAWLKRGYRPYSMHVVIDGQVRAAIPVTRAGQILAYPTGIAAAMDDVAWKRKQNKAIGKGVPDSVSQEVLAGISTYYNIVGAQGIFQSVGHISQLAQGGGGIGRAIGVTAAGTAAALAIPGKSLIAGVSDMIYGPVDRSSVNASIIANFPVLNALVNGKAVNRFGDEIGDRSFYSKISNLGIPIAIRVADTPVNKALYQMVLDKGAAPPDLRRYIVEDKYGPLTQDQWNKFVRLSGNSLKQTVLASLDQLKAPGMPPTAVREFMVKTGSSANDQAAYEMGLQPVPKASGGSMAQSTSGGGGSAASVSLPTTPKMASLGLPKAPGSPARSVSSPGTGVSGGRTGFSAGPAQSFGGGAPARGITPRTSLGRARGGGGMPRRLSLSGRRTAKRRFVGGRLRARTGKSSMRRIGLRRSARPHRISLHR